jgi:queuine tRNA-ribosyltransferase
MCAERLVEMDFPAYAIGGVSVGESHEQVLDVVAEVCPMLPADRPRYLMGVGMPRDIVAAVACGVDMFDCVLPTRNGRNAYAFTASGSVRLRNAKYRLDDAPLEAGCDCVTCANHSRAYLRHLFMTGEMLGPILVSLHNLHFYQRLMARLRDLIQSGGIERIFDEFPVAAAEGNGVEDERA